VTEAILENELETLKKEIISVCLMYEPNEAHATYGLHCCELISYLIKSLICRPMNQGYG